MKKIFATILTVILALSCALTPFAAVESQINTPTLEKGDAPDTLIGFDVDYKATAPVMDGVINDGEYHRVAFSDVKKYFNFIVGSSLADSVSFDDLAKFAKDDMEVYACWNKGKLYFAVSTYAGKAEFNCQFTDNEVYMFRGWCLQVAVTDMKAVNQDRAEVGIGYDPNSKEMISYTKWGTRKNVDLVAGESFATNWDKDEERVTYEICLDLSKILGTSPKNNDTFRFGFCLCMGDGDISSDNMQKQVEFAHGIAMSKVVTNLAITTLTGGPANAGDGEGDTTPDDDPVEEEQDGFNAADRFDKDGAAALFDITDGSLSVQDMTDANGEKFVRFTATGKNPIIGSSKLTQGLNMDAEGAYIAIRCRTNSTKSNTLAVNFVNSACPTLSRDNDYEADYGIRTDGEWDTLVFEMYTNTDWQQFITNFYICPFTSTEDPTGESLDIQWIKYYSEDANFSFGDEESFSDKIGDNIKPADTKAPEEEVTEVDTTNAVTNKPAADTASNNKGNDDAGSNTVLIVVAIVAAVVVVGAVVFIIIKKKKN